MKHAIRIRIGSDGQPGADLGLELTEGKEFDLTGKVLGLAAMRLGDKVLAILTIKQKATSLRVGPDSYSLLVNGESGDEFVLHRIELGETEMIRQYGGEELVLRKGDKVTITDRTVEFVDIPEAPPEVSSLQSTVDSQAQSLRGPRVVKQVTVPRRATLEALIENSTPQSPPKKPSVEREPPPRQSIGEILNAVVEIIRELLKPSRPAKISTQPSGETPIVLEINGRPSGDTPPAPEDSDETPPPKQKPKASKWIKGAMGAAALGAAGILYLQQTPGLLPAPSGDRAPASVQPPPDPYTPVAQAPTATPMASAQPTLRPPVNVLRVEEIRLIIQAARIEARTPASR